MFSIYFNTSDLSKAAVYIGNWQSFPQADRAFARAIWQSPAVQNYRTAPFATIHQDGDLDTRELVIDVVNPQTGSSTTPADLIALWRRYVAANPPTPAMRGTEGDGVEILRALAKQICLDNGLNPYG